MAKPGRKSTEDEVRRRLDWLEERLASQGWGYRVRRAYIEKYGLSERQAQREAKKILDRLKETHDQVTLEQRRAIYREKSQAIQTTLLREFLAEAAKRPDKDGNGGADDRKLARLSGRLQRLMYDEAKIEGLLAAERVEISGPAGGPVQISRPDPEEFQRLAEELIASGKLDLGGSANEE